jgi:hypothetical protein
MNVEFFELLYADRGFCESMGRMALAAGRFESNLKALLRVNKVVVNQGQLSLGPLIGLLERHGFLSENGVTVLRDLKRQRNYLYHSLFDLFAARIPETVLPRTELVPIDVEVFAEKAQVLEENFRGLSAIVERRLEQLPTNPTAPDLLFRP